MAVTPKVGSLARKKQQGMLPQFSQTQTSTNNTTTQTPTYTNMSDWTKAQGQQSLGSTVNKPETYSSNGDIIKRIPSQTQDTTTTTTIPKQPVFGTTASQIQSTSPSYLTDRNTKLSQDYLNKGYTSYQDVYNELSKSQDFATASDTDKTNTATDIFNRMKTAVTTNLQDRQTKEQAQAIVNATNPVESATIETPVYSTGEQYTDMDWDKAIANAQDPGLKQELIRQREAKKRAESDFTAGINYGVKQHENKLSDLQFEYDLKTKELNKQLEDAKLKVGRQISDVEKMMSRNIALQEKSGALSGLNRGAGFTQGLNNIKQDSLNIIERLQVDLNLYNNAVGEAKEVAFRNFNENKQRAFDNFTYQYRNLLDQTSIDLAKAAGKFPTLSSEGLKKEISKIKENFFLQGQQAQMNWQNQQIAINQEARADIDQIMKIQSFADMQEDRILNTLNANGGEGYLGLSTNDLADMVQRGDITPKMAMVSMNIMKSKAQSTLQAMSIDGIVPPADMEAVIAAIDSGMSTQQAISSVSSKDTKRYSKPLDTNKWMSVKPGERLFNPATGEYMDVPGGIDDGRPSSTQTSQQPINNVTLPQVDENNVVASVQRFNGMYKDGDIGGQCGAFVNEYTKSLGLGELFSDPITQKAGLSNTQTPTVGSVFITDSKQFPQYGHVGIVTKVNADGSFETLESNKAGEGSVFRRTIPAGGAKYGFFDPRLGKQPTTISSSGPIDPANSSPLAYSQRIKNMVPIALKNNVAEMEKLDNIIKQLYASGANPEDAMLTFMGIDVPNESDKQFISALISKGRGLEDKDKSWFVTMADYVNNGKRTEAVNYLEREAIKQAQKNNPDVKISEVGSTWAIKQYKGVIDLINQYESKFGPITGTWNKLTKGWTGDKEAQEIASKISAAITKMRHDLIGATMTQGERSAISDLIPDLGETADTAIVKIKTLKDNTLGQYNTLRDNVGLPELTEETLLDKGKRVALYGSDTQSTTTTTETTTTSTGGGRWRK